MPRDKYDQWVLEAFGVDPGTYPLKADSPAAVPPTGKTGGVGVVPLPAATGASDPKAPSAAKPTDAANKPAALLLAHQTEARQPSNRARTKIGVGERVNLTVKPGPGTWTATKGTLGSTTGSATLFTAPAVPGAAEVSVSVGEQTAKVEFEVIAPTSVHMTVGGKRHIANGQPNAGFHANIYVGPADVSFANIEFLEHDIGAKANGYWANFNGVGHSPGKDWGTMEKIVASGLGTKSSFMDNCLSGCTGVGQPFAGSFSFSIPWYYRVGSGSGTKFATVVQSVVSGADGTTTITKGGASVTFKLTDGEETYAGAIY